MAKTRLRKRTKRTKRTRTKRTKRTKGGVLFTATPGQDIRPEIIRFANEGTVKMILAGSYGLIFEITLPEESPVFCGVNSILVKVVTLDSDFKYNFKYDDDDQEEVIEIRKINIPNFQKEVDIQIEVCKRSIDKFQCSIAPTLLYADIYTDDELMGLFPKIGNEIKPTGRVGLVFMEHIKDVKYKLTARPIVGWYNVPDSKNYAIEKLFPLSRRLLIMLAQLGFYHNDFHPGNILCAVNTCYIIDFGKATPIPEDKLAEFKRDVELYDSPDYDESLKVSLKVKIIKFLYGIHKLPLTEAQLEDDTFFTEGQWLCHNQIDTAEPGIDPTIVIATQDEVVKSIKIEEDKKKIVCKHQ